MIDTPIDFQLLEIQEKSSLVALESSTPVDISLQDDAATLVLQEEVPVVVVQELTTILQITEDPMANIVEIIEKGPSGPRGIPGSVASLSKDADQLAEVGIDQGILVKSQSVRQVAADQDAVLIFDFDGLVAATLGV